MEKLIDNLQKHPVAVLSMFILSILSAVITIILGWDQFYSTFLSKEIKIPIWFACICALVAVSAYIVKSSPQKKNKELTSIEGKEFGVQQIELDGKKFVNCKFDGSELIFRGINGFSLEHNNFKTPPRISFQDHAGLTFAVIKMLYKDQNFKPYVDGALK